MFYCVLHNWYSSEEPCPACHKTYTVTTSGSTTSEHQPKEELKEPERGDVSGLTDITTSNMMANSWKYVFLTYNKPILQSKYPAIKQAIEQVLNDETLPFYIYTQEQVNKMMEDAATGFTHYLEFIMNDDDWLKDDGDGMKSMPEVYNDFTQWKNSKKSSLK